MVWLFVPNGLICVFQKLLISMDFHTKHPLSGRSTVWAKMPCWWEVKGEWLDWHEVYTKSSNNSLQPCWTEKHFRMNNMLNFVVDVLQQEKTIVRSNPVGGEQESDAIIGTHHQSLTGNGLRKTSKRFSIFRQSLDFFVCLFTMLWGQSHWDCSICMILCIALLPHYWLIREEERCSY